ncbi:MAG: alpha/beta hydrolase [Desulfobulbaceae bacterium A2]|nr:MAG: alpha/beta hydrolase [Desulfobulbaceae bacterium A2]
MPAKILFLPGASGNIRFWEPVSNLLSSPAERVHVGWPGFGPTPADARVQGIDDLVAQVCDAIQGPTALFAQSMGGVIAVRAALEKRDLITHLVLTATSGGMDMARLGAQDWRPGFVAANPTLPPWFSSYQEDLTPRLRRVDIPTLVLCGDADPISPVSAGRYLAALLPHSDLHIIAGGTHTLAETHAHVIAPLIDAHLAQALPAAKTC